MTLKDKLKNFKFTKTDWKIEPSLLLCPNIPKPLHGVAPRVINGRKWWDETRKATYKSTDYHCKACGVSKYDAKYHQWLEAHEIYLINYAKGTSTYTRSVPLCHFCHNYIHDGRLKMLLQEGKIHHAKYVAVLRHGDKVLREAGLEREAHEDRLPKKFAKWNKWRLILDGRKYKPLMTEAAWRKANV